LIEREARHLPDTGSLAATTQGPQDHFQPIVGRLATLTDGLECRASQLSCAGNRTYRRGAAGNAWTSTDATLLKGLNEWNLPS
jgi:hypothetical protein